MSAQREMTRPELLAELVRVTAERDELQKLVEAKMVVVSSADLQAEVARYKAAIEAAEHRLRMTAERTADYTPEGIALRIQHDADLLAAALAAPDERPNHENAYFDPDAAFDSTIPEGARPAALVVPVDPGSNVQRPGLDVPSDAPTPVDDQQDEPQRCHDRHVIDPDGIRIGQDSDDLDFWEQCPDTEPWCCDACKGTGTVHGSPETGGRCWDCRGTGHAHPADIPCAVSGDTTQPLDPDCNDERCKLMLPGAHTKGEFGCLNEPTQPDEQRCPHGETGPHPKMVGGRTPMDATVRCPGPSSGVGQQ